MNASNNTTLINTPKAPWLHARIKRRLYASVGMLMVVCAVFFLPQDTYNVQKSSMTGLVTAMVTGVFVYCVSPLCPRLLSEIRTRKPGPAMLVSCILGMFWLHALAGVVRNGDLEELNEFAVLLFCSTMGYAMVMKTSSRMTGALSSQKKQIDDILESIDDVVWSMNAQTLDLLYANAACEQVTGYKAAELIADKNILLNSVYPDDKNMFYTALQTAVTKGEAVCEFRVYHKRGTVRYLRGSAKLQRNADGIKVLSGVTMDITRQRLAEMQLEAKAKEIEEILNSINDVFFAMDNNFTISYVNKEFEKLYSRRAADLVGLSFREIAPGQNYKTFYSECRNVINEQSSTSFEMYNDTFDKWFLFKVYPTEYGVSVYLTDITSQKVMMEEIIADKKKLEAQNEKLSQIAWAQSHKVRSPLANILGLVQLIDPKDNISEDNQAVLEGIRIASEHLDTMIREISELASCEEMKELYELQYQHHTAET